MRRASHNEQGSGGRWGAVPPRRLSAGGSELVTDDSGVDSRCGSVLVVEQETPGEALRISRQAAERLRTSPTLAGCGSASSGCGSGSDSSRRVSLLSQQLRVSNPGSGASVDLSQGALAASSIGSPLARRGTVIRSALSAEIRQHDAATRSREPPAGARDAATITALECSGRSNSTPLPHIMAVDTATQELGGLALASSAGAWLQPTQLEQVAKQPSLQDSCLRQDEPSDCHPVTSWSSTSPSPPIGLPSLRASPTAVPGAPQVDKGRWLETSLGPGIWITISPSSHDSSGSLDNLSL